AARPVLIRIARRPTGEAEIAAQVARKPSTAAEPAQAGATKPRCTAEAAQAAEATGAGESHVGRTTNECCRLGLGNARSPSRALGPGPWPLRQLRLLNGSLRKRRPQRGERFRLHGRPRDEERFVQVHLK